MTPRMSIIGQIAHLRFLARFRGRAIVFGGPALAFFLLAFFPERHLVTSSVMPLNSYSLGLSDVVGQLDAPNSAFGNQAAVEVALRVGNSADVRDLVIEKTFLKERLGTENRASLQRYLADHIKIRPLRGGIIAIEMQNRDADLALKIVSAYQVALKVRLEEINRQETAYRRDVLKRLATGAAAELGQAQAAYDDFRLRNRYATAPSAIPASVDRVLKLEEATRSKQIQIAIASQTYLDTQPIVARIAELQIELIQARALMVNRGGKVGELDPHSSQSYHLSHELETAKWLYNGYLAYLQDVSVGQMSADASLRVVEAVHVDPERQVWLPALALAIFMCLLWVGVELYRLRPPPGEAPERLGHD